MSIYDRFNLSDRFDERGGFSSPGGFLGTALDDIRSQIPSGPEISGGVPYPVEGGTLRYPGGIPVGGSVGSPPEESIPLFSGDGSFTTPSVNLGGGLGAIPGVSLNIFDILAQLPQNQMFGIPTAVNDPNNPFPNDGRGVPEPPPFDPDGDIPVSDSPLNDYPFVDPETGGDLVLVPGDPNNPVIVRDPETGELPPGFTDDGPVYPPGTIIEPYIPPSAPVMPDAPVTDSIEEVVSDEVVDEVVPPTTTPSPPPPPVVDTTGIGSLPQVVLPPTPAEDMDLITGTDAGLTDEEIESVANPTLTPTTGADLDRLNQQYNDTFLRFLSQDTTQQDTTPVDTSVYDYITPEGIQSGLQAGEFISRFGQQFPFRQQPIDYGSGRFNTYSTPADVQFQMRDVFDRGLVNNTNNFNRFPNNTYQQYGNLQFPVFGSGVTSLVPQQAVNELFKR